MKCFQPCIRFLYHHKIPETNTSTIFNQNTLPLNYSSIDLQFNHRFSSSSNSDEQTSDHSLTEESIVKRVISVAAKMERVTATVDEMSSKTNIQKELGLDSLDFVEFGLALEDEFEIEIEDEKAENIVTIGDAVAVIIELKNGSVGSSESSSS